MKPNPVVHFEMPYKDAKRVSKFYKTVFSWGIRDAGKAMGNYVLAMTTPAGKDGRPKDPGAINGGFFDITKANAHPSVVIAVDDIKKSIEMVKKSGGKIVGKPQDIPGIGMWVAFRDPEGNRVSMLQASR